MLPIQNIYGHERSNSNFTGHLCWLGSYSLSSWLPRNGTESSRSSKSIHKGWKVLFCPFWWQFYKRTFPGNQDYVYNFNFFWEFHMMFFDHSQTHFPKSFQTHSHFTTHSVLILILFFINLCLAQIFFLGCAQVNKVYSIRGNWLFLQAAKFSDYFFVLGWDRMPQFPLHAGIYSCLVLKRSCSC